MSVRSLHSYEINTFIWTKYYEFKGGAGDEVPLIYTNNI